jgi:hypothetical protein
LKAINFGGLLTMPTDTLESNTEDARTENKTGNPPTAVTDHSTSSGVGVVDARTNLEGRAELQAQLALLAAQLAEIGEDDDERSDGESGEEKMELCDS